MIVKIEPELLKKVIIESDKNNLNCVVFANNYNNLLRRVRNNKITLVEELPFINAVCVKMDRSNLMNMAECNNVRYITSVTKVTSCINVSKKIMGVENVAIKNSSNFSVAVIDTGIYPHLDFTLGKNRILTFHDVINGRNIPYDDNGHGTFVAGLIVSSGFLSSGKYSGVDPNVNIVSVKALDENGETNSLNILKAMQWVYSNKEKYNIKVVCMSFGSLVLNYNDPLIIGAESLWNSGIVVCSASGNSGPEVSTIKSPGASSKIITVGALSDNRNEDESFDEKKFKVADFSSRGPILNNYKPDLVVSGVDVVSACNYKINKSFYGKMSGSSVSTPIVAGICSLLTKKYPNYTPNQIKKLLITHCKKIKGDRNEEGFGWLNIKKVFIN